MVKTKQVASKRPANLHAPPIQRAIKSAKCLKSSLTSLQSPDLVIKPNDRSQNVLLARKSIAQAPMNLATKKIKKLAIVPSSRFVLNSIPRRAFQRMVRSIMTKFIPDARITQEAMEALQVSTEDFLVGYFEDAASCAQHAKRVTLMAKDMHLVAKLRNFKYEPL